GQWTRLWQVGVDNVSGLVEGIVLHHWCQWELKCPIIFVNRRNSALSLVSTRGIVPHHWWQWEE
ncbi:unnamed protein product, partial [Staurois parvus]